MTEGGYKLQIITDTPFSYSGMAAFQRLPTGTIHTINYNPPSAQNL